MKKLLFALAIISAFAITSCGNYTEEIYLEEDGTGRYVMSSDIIPGATEMAVSMTKMFANMDGNEVELDEDSLRMAVLAEVWEDFPDEVDSVIDLTADLPEDVKNNPEYLKYIELAKGFMRGSKESGSILMGMEYSFSSIENFQGFITFMEETQAKQSEARTGTPMDALGKTKSSTSYKSKPNSFARTTIYTNAQSDDKSLESLREMMGDGKIQTIVYTKRKIKKAHGKQVKLVEDYKVVLEYDFIDALSGQVNTDFEIIFE